MSQDLNFRRKRRKRLRRNKTGSLFLWILEILIVCMTAVLLVAALGQRVSTAGDSMSPVLKNGNVVLVNHFIYNFKDPARGDIIAFRQDETRHYMLKRVVGLPGETVQIVDGYVYIDGQKLDEHYGNEVMENPGIAEEPLVLGDDEYFVLGDNRNNSQDSRAANVGVIHKDDLLGRAWVRIWPLNKFGVIKHE